MTEIASSQAPAAEPRWPSRMEFGPRRLLVAASLVFVLAAASLAVSAALGGPGGHGATAFAIEKAGPKTISIEVVNSRGSADELTQQLRAAGLGIVVRTTPSSPQLVGRWLALEAAEGVSARLRDQVADQALNTTATLRVPAHFEGTLTLTVGRAPRSGEHVLVAGTPNALAPGGKLFCTGLRGLSPAAAAGVLAQQGLAVQWAEGGERRPLSQPIASDQVVQAFVYDTKALAPAGFPTDGSTVQVVLSNPKAASYETLRWTGFPHFDRADRDSASESC